MAVAEVGFAEECHVNEAHSAEAEAEDKHVAGEVEAWRIREVEGFDPADFRYGEGTFDGAVYPGVDVAEGAAVFDDTAADGAVVDGAEYADVE